MIKLPYVFITLLEYYHSKIHLKDFDAIFGKYYVGKNSPPLANKYLVLTFEFSGIDTQNNDTVFKQSAEKVKAGIRTLMRNYPEYFSEKAVEQMDSTETAASAVSALLNVFREKKLEEKIYVLINEYDHFTNELIAFNLDDFRAIVSRNGFVRKFFKVLKEGTLYSFIDG